MPLPALGLLRDACSLCCPELQLPLLLCRSIKAKVQKGVHLHPWGHTCMSPTPHGHRGPWETCLALPAPPSAPAPGPRWGSCLPRKRGASLPPSLTPQAQLTSNRLGLPRRKGTTASSHQYFTRTSHKDQKLGLSSLALIFWSCSFFFPLLMSILCQKMTPRMVSLQRMAISSLLTSTRKIS